MSANSHSRKKIVPALTGIRAIAAYLVFFHHFPFSSDVVGQLGFCMLREGHIGVGIFFVLSGFVIAYNYTDQFREGYRGYFSYLRNRFARIYPIFFLTTAVALFYLGDYNNSKAWFYNLTLLRGFFGQWYFYHIGQAWSLTTECTFYLVAPLLLRYVTKVPIGILCLIIYGVGALLTFLPIPLEDFFVPYRMVVVNTFFGRAFEFLLGIWLFQYFVSKELWRICYRLGLCTYLGFISIIGCIYIFAECSGLAVYSLSCSPLHHYLFPSAVALFLLGLWKEETLLAKLLSTRPMILAGQSSYVFYLIHAAPFQEMLGMTEWQPGYKFAVFVALSAIIYLVIERPLHRLLRSPRKQVST